MWLGADKHAAYVKRMQIARADWLEDVLAGLLSNGVDVNEIHVGVHPFSRTVISVRGTPRYEWTIEQPEGRVLP